ncbi:MAG: hypothetical protein ACI4D7_10440 [Lachnospiraceae bacterium]
MTSIEMKASTIGVKSSHLMEEVAELFIKEYGKKSLSVNKSEENLPNTKGIITTAIVIDFISGVAQGLTVSAISAIVSVAIKKVFTKKEADEITITIEDNCVIVESCNEVNVNVVIKV